jgi:hypothetical protein
MKAHLVGFPGKPHWEVPCEFEEKIESSSEDLLRIINVVGAS